MGIYAIVNRRLISNYIPGPTLIDLLTLDKATFKVLIVQLQLRPIKLVDTITDKTLQFMKLLNLPYFSWSSAFYNMERVNLSFFPAELLPRYKLNIRYCLDLVIRDLPVHNNSLNLERVEFFSTRFLPKVFLTIGILDTFEVTRYVPANCLIIKEVQKVKIFKFK